MQGRAGRRGMDVQGNVIYLGMAWSYIENLMLGQITNVTGSAIAASNDPDDKKQFVHDDKNLSSHWLFVRCNVLRGATRLSLRKQWSG